MGIILLCVIPLIVPSTCTGKEGLKMFQIRSKNTTIALSFLIRNQKTWNHTAIGIGYFLGFLDFLSVVVFPYGPCYQSGQSIRLVSPDEPGRQPGETAIPAVGE